MRFFAVLQVMFFSFYSGKLYRLVAQKWRGLGFFYLFLLLAICWLPITIKIHHDFNLLRDQQLTKIADNWPLMTIKNGKLSIDQTSPYIIQGNPPLDFPLVRFDTSDTPPLLTADERPFAYVTQRQVEFMADNQVEIFPFNNIENDIISKTDVQNALQFISSWCGFIGYPIFLLISFLYRVVQVLLFACIGFILSNLLKRTLKFEAIMRITAVALSPAIIISAIIYIFSLNVPAAFMLVGYTFMILCYLFFGIWVNDRLENDTIPD